jgi:hypothetical protein
LQRINNTKSWLVELATGAKRKISELVKYYPLDINGINTKVYVSIIPLISYDYLIGMDWLGKHHVVPDCYNKKITCIDEDVQRGKVQGILRDVVVREISAMQLKKSFGKGYHILSSHMKEVVVMRNKYMRLGVGPQQMKQHQEINSNLKYAR